MNKEEAVQMIDDHKNKMINPLELLNWTCIRVMINAMTDDEWEALQSRAAEIMSR